VRKNRAPWWVAAILLRLLPEEYGEDVLADLEADAERRFAGIARRGPRREAWYLRQVTSPSMLALAWKLRSKEGRTMGTWTRSLGTDLRHGARGLARSPLFTLAAALSLGLGIGANTAIFSVINAVLIRPPPYHEPERLVFVWNDLAGFDLPRLPLAGIQLVELRGEEDVFEDVAGIWAGHQNLGTEDRATLVTSGLITPNFFSLLGVDPQLGRSFLPEEGAGEATVLLSDEMWRRELGGDPDVIGRKLRLEGREATVVGVLPPGMKLLFPPSVGIPERLDLFVPFPWVTAAQPGGSRFLRTVARTREGVTLATADATVKEVAGRLRATYVEMAAVGDEFSAAPLQADTTERIRPTLLALLVGVGIFLLLTSVNVASLLLARGTSRGREMAIRSCLGASGGRLARLVTGEVAAITVLGAVSGLLLGGWGADVLWSLRPEGIARVDDVGLDLRVVAFTLAAAALAGGLAGLWPLARLRRQAPMELLRQTGAGRAPTSRRGAWAITVAEVALSVVLVVGAALMAQTLTSLREADLGFQSDGLLTFRVGLSLRQFPEAEERAALARQLEDELGDLSGVVAAGAVSHIPLADWANWSSSAAPEGTPEEGREAFHFDHRSATPGYLDALGVTLVGGRFFTSGDDAAGQPVVIIDETLAQRAFPGEDAVGRVLLATRYLDGDFVPTPAVVVGVIEDLRDRGPAVPSAGQVYWPFAQSARWELTYAVRTVGGGEATLAALADEVRALVPEVRRDLAAADFRTLDSYLAGSIADTRFTSLLAGLFSVLALGLASLGLYGVISYSTARRTREMGLHLALGARAPDLFFRVVGEGLAVGAVGVAVGLAGAAGLTRYMEALLFGVNPLDPVVFGGVGAFLVLVAVAASAGPALRAASVDPVRSLHVE